MGSTSTPCVHTCTQSARRWSSHWTHRTEPGARCLRVQVGATPSPASSSHSQTPGSTPFAEATGVQGGRWAPPAPPPPGRAWGCTPGATHPPRSTLTAVTEAQEATPHDGQHKEAAPLERGRGPPSLPWCLLVLTCLPKPARPCSAQRRPQALSDAPSAPTTHPAPGPGGQTLAPLPSWMVTQLDQGPGVQPSHTQGPGPLRPMAWPSHCTQPRGQC